ncbi:beta-1,3-galactosyltransferase 2-like [Mixophyes fleayi]|uniref:beta-1,3-galactosyltransferase 2-like n=1 Tax=Mixophyes fleayi TaxID=3061075 RepID=UPI003F4DBFA1
MKSQILKYILLVLIFILISGYLSYKNITENHLKVKVKKTPVNNLTYPAFQHPLAPPYPFPYKFLINQPEKCKDRNPFLIILVASEIQDIEARNAIRETWGNKSNYDVDVVTLFLVGISKLGSDRVQWKLEEESEAFGDIVQQDFLDTYYNLTLKSIMGIEWVVKFCPTASYIMKTDNDMFLNADYLVHRILHPELPVRTDYFTGYIVENAKPYRSEKSKWYVPKEIYPNDTYPPYCMGAGYVFSVDMAKKIYDVSQVIRMIPMEDVHLGICLYELKIPLTSSTPNKFNVKMIAYNRCKFKQLVTVHSYKKEKLRSVWEDFWGKRSLAC